MIRALIADLLSRKDLSRQQAQYEADMQAAMSMPRPGDPDAVWVAKEETSPYMNCFGRWAKFSSGEEMPMPYAGLSGMGPFPPKGTITHWLMRR